MSARRPIEFGYNPPTGNRLLERVEPSTFVRDLQHVLDRACQRFDSIWISDHHMTADRFRLECWTQLTWVAARFPGACLAPSPSGRFLLDVAAANRAQLEAAGVPGAAIHRHRACTRESDELPSHRRRPDGVRFACLAAIVVS